MGSIHSELVGDELHIARTFVSTGDPNGVVTPGIIGEFYWDSTANQLYVAESLLNTSWVTTTNAFDSFLELTDTPGSYSGQAGFVTQVNVAEDGLEFGQALRLIDTPQFANLLLKPASAVDVNFIIQDFSGAEKLDIEYNSTLDLIDIESQVGLLLRTSAGGIALSTGTLSISIASAQEDVRLTAEEDIRLTVNTGNFSVNTDQLFVRSSDGFVGFGSDTPLAKLFVSSPSADTVPVSMQESLGTNGSRIKTLVGTQDPEGNVTGDSGDHYWRVNGANSDLFIKTSDGVNTGWASVLDTTGFDEFIELTDTPADYSLQNNFVVQVNQGATGLVFGQALRPVDGPVFNGIELQQISTEDVVFQIIDDFPLTQFRILLDDSEDEIIIDSVLPLIIDIDNGLTIDSGSTTIPIDTISAIDDTIPVTTLATIGTNGAKIQTFVGTQAPEGLITGDAGDHYWRVDGLNSSLFVKRSAGSSTTGWDPVFATGNVTTPGILTDNFLIRGNGLETIDIGNIFMSADGNGLTIPGALDLIPPEPFVVQTFIDNVALNGVNHITVVNNYAYVVNSIGNSFTIVDITDPSAMFVVGTLVDPIILTTLTSVHVSGKYAFVTSNITDCLNVIDITDVSAPVLVGRVVDAVAMNAPDQSFVASRFCYVIGASSNSLAVIDISDPEAPFVAGSLISPFGLTDPRAMYVYGKFAYITLLVGKLAIVDISDPTNPVLLGTYTDNTDMNQPTSVYVVGRFAYVTGDASDSFSIIDISDPNNPTLFGRLIDSVNLNRPKNISIDGDYAYVGTIGPPNTFVVIDISDRTTPVIIQILGVAGGGGDFFVSGKFAYLTNSGTDSIASIDLGGIDVSTANIGNISAGYISVDNDVHIKGLLTASGLDVGVHGIHSDGGISASGELKVIPSAPMLLGSLNDAVNLLQVRSVAVVNNYAYCASDGGGSLAILDITEPTNPVIVGVLIDVVNFPDAFDVHVTGKYGYLISQSTDSLNIIDVSDVSAPVLVGRVVDAVNINSPEAIFVAGKFCYVLGNNSNSLAIFDITDPTDPVLVGSLLDGTNLNGPTELYIAGEFAYVVCGPSDRLTVLDISDPTSPAVLGTLVDAVNMNAVNNIYVRGRYAYVISGAGDSLAILDISDPNNPALVGSLIDSVNMEQPFGLSVDGKYAYVSTLSATPAFLVIDISDPTNPIITQRFLPGLGQMTDLFVSGKHAYVVSNSLNNFIVIDVNGIDASTGDIGNLKTGYLSVDNEAQVDGILYAGGINAGANGIHSDGDISGSTLFATSPNLDLIPISRLKNSSILHPGTSKKFVGDRDPNGVITGEGGDVYFRGVGQALTFGSYESRGVIPGDTVWFKRSVNPPAIVEINTNAEFEALASGGIITVSTALTLDFNIIVPTTTRFVLDFAPLTITGIGGITYTGAGILFSGSGNLKISGGINLNGDGTATLMEITGNIVAVNINRATITLFPVLGSFENGAFSLAFVGFVNCAAGFTLTNALIISVFKVAGIAENNPTAFPMTTALFTVNTNNELSIATFNDVLNTVGMGSVFDFNTRINQDISVLSVIETVAKSFPGGGNADIFKQTAVPTVALLSVNDISPLTNTISSMADNFSNGTTIAHGGLATYFDDEIVTISGTTSYNGTFQIFNVVPNVSFDINMTFVGDDATGSIDAEVIALNIPFGHPVVAGDSIKVTGTNFYNAFYTVFESGPVSVSVNASFISTNTGTLEINLSLDETDIRIFAAANVLSATSIFLGAAFVNANPEPTVIAVTGTYQDALFGTVGSALIASATMAKWRMINELNGTFEFITNTVFDGWITFDFTVLSVGGVLAFRIKFVISTDGGATFVDLPDPVEALIEVGGDAVNVSKTFDIQLNKGDLIKPQVVRDAGNSTITFNYATINVRQ